MLGVGPNIADYCGVVAAFGPLADEVDRPRTIQIEQFNMDGQPGQEINPSLFRRRYKQLEEETRQYRDCINFNNVFWRGWIHDKPFS